MNEPAALSAQDIFDRVATHLAHQKKRAHQEGVGCRYRTSDGLQCAVGCLITDAEYTPFMDYVGDVDDLIKAMVLPHRFYDHVELLKDLQGVHDAYEPHQWKEKLQRVAIEHDLDPTTVLAATFT